MVGEIRNVKLDQDNSNHLGIFIEFTMNDEGFFILLKKNKEGIWEPVKVVHYDEDVTYCKFCKKEAGMYTACEELTLTEGTLSEIYRLLLNHPAIRLRMLMDGVGKWN